VHCALPHHPIHHPLASESGARRYCARTFTGAEIARIRELIAARPDATRAELSRIVCHEFSWMRPDGRSKEMSCRVAMLRMQRDGLLQLPPPRNGNNNGKPYRRRTPQSEPGAPIRATSPRHLGPLTLQAVTDRRDSHLHNEFLARYHYLGYQPLPGDQLRYFVHAGDRLVALLGFGAAAWTTRPRDRFIGWNPSQRQQHLHRVVNNARFLILPWVECRNLASAILARAARTVPGDWATLYGYRPVLFETFVEQPRFRGIAYQAANWTCVGTTEGRGKLDVHHQHGLPKKSVWVYPLDRRFRQVLCQ